MKTTSDKIAKLLLVSALSFLTISSIAQQSKVQFDALNDTVIVSRTKKLLYKVNVSVSSLSKDSTYYVSLIPDFENSSLAKTSYKISSTVIVKSVNEQKFFFLIDFEKETEVYPDRTLKLHLILQIERKDTNNKIYLRDIHTSESASILVKTEEPLSQYNYLSFIGTNFDLVDGVQANKLFFATNVFIPNNQSIAGKGNKGFPGSYFSIYGNRSFSFNDTTAGVKRATQSVQINDTTYRNLNESVDVSRTYNSDNIGALYSMLINIGGWSDSKKSFQIWAAPTFEFIWRRTESRFSYQNPRDTFSSYSSVPISTNNQNSFTQYGNQYEFNYGIGLFMNHSNDNICVRFHWSIGGNSVWRNDNDTQLENAASFYKVGSDWAFLGKLWIIEPKTGITLQAEISNKFKNPTPFYTVTLSKAFELSSLSGVFSPITKRVKTL